VITFLNIQHILYDYKINFHSYALPEEQPLKILFRGIPSSFSGQFEKGELFNYEFHHLHTPITKIWLLITHVFGHFSEQSGQ